MIIGLVYRKRLAQRVLSIREYFIHVSGGNRSGRLLEVYCSTYLKLGSSST